MLASAARGTQASELQRKVVAISIGVLRRDGFYYVRADTDKAVEPLVGGWLCADDSAFCLPSFLFLRLIVLTSCLTELSPAIVSRIVVQHADARGLCDGLIWPKTGYASIV